MNRFRSIFRIDNRELVLTGSIGIAVYPTDGQTPAELLRSADMAMYRAKELGRNTYHYFTEALNDRVGRLLAVEEQLHGALERGEFTVLYQPLMAVRSQEIVGAEALLRWHNAALGDVSPDEFIAVAESSGLIVTIGHHVLKAAVRTLVDWRRLTGRDLLISVNISPRQLFDPGLSGFVAAVLHETECPAVSSNLK